VGNAVTDFGDVIIDSAVLIVSGGQLTATRGGLTFDPGEEWEDFEYPGRTMNTKGCRELVRLKPTIKGNAMMMGEAQLAVYRPDGQWSDSTLEDVRLFRPNALRTDLVAGDYLTNVFCVWQRQRGDLIAVEFPYAIASSWSIGSTDNDEGLIALTIEAAQSPLTGTTKTRVPYRVHTFPFDTEVADL
jgi:hypothetical protein